MNSCNFVRARGVIVAVLLSLLVGCGSRLQTAYAVRGACNSALAEALRLHSAGEIDSPTLARIGEMGRAAEPVLDELDRCALEDDAFRWVVVVESAHRQIDELLREVLLARQGRSR